MRAMILEGVAGAGRFGRLLWLSMRGQGPLLGAAAALVAMVAGLGRAVPGLPLMAPVEMLAVAVSMVLVLLLTELSRQFIAMVLGDRPDRPTRELARRLAGFLGSARHMALGLPALVALLLLVIGFTAIKASIPVLRPFDWDARLDQIDAALHFGRRPWEWLQPLLGHWPVTLVLSVAYHLWYMVLLAVWLQFAFHTAPGITRTRFLIAFMLLWLVGGGAAALAMSSAGPCFFGAGHLGLSPDPYAALMAYLRETGEIVPLWPLEVQRELWQLYLANSPVGSISAMPSLHNGSALLFALASGGWPRWIRRLLWAYVVVIFLGSIHLAWHYAVDGYAAWVLALAAWMLARPLARLCEARATARRLAVAFVESPASL